MYRSILFISLFALLLNTSCKQCDQVFPLVESPSKFNLKTSTGTELWFGVNSVFNPDSADFYVFRNGLKLPLATTVKKGNDQMNRYVACNLPTNEGDLIEIRVVLSKTDSINFRYAHELDEINCQVQREINLIEQYGEFICNRCGVPEIDGGPGEIIILKKI
jgi:hypothetical protein